MRRTRENEAVEFLKVQDLCEEGVVFAINSVIFKHDVPSKFGISDVAYVNIDVAGTEYMISVRQKVLLDDFVDIIEKRDDGRETNFRKRYVIAYPDGKNYYALFEAD